MTVRVSTLCAVLGYVWNQSKCRPIVSILCITYFTY